MTRYASGIAGVTPTVLGRSLRISLKGLPSE